MDKTIEDRLRVLEASSSSAETFERIVRTLSILGAAIVFGLGVYQYYDTKRSEFRKAFWEKQYSLYVRASSAAAKIASTQSLDEVSSERAEFWTLYWGELSIVEDKAVHDAMVAFGTDLSELEAVPQRANGLRQLSYCLARACRESLKNTWEPVPLDDIPVKKTSDRDAESKD